MCQKHYKKGWVPCWPLRQSLHKAYRLLRQEEFEIRNQTKKTDKQERQKSKIKATPPPTEKEAINTGSWNEGTQGIELEKTQGERIDLNKQGGAVNKDQVKPIRLGWAKSEWQEKKHGQEVWKRMTDEEVLTHK